MSQVSKYAWWRYWMEHEMDLTKLHLKLNPSTDFPSAATVIVVVGHQRNKELALAILNKFSERLRADEQVKMGDKGMEAVVQLLKHKEALDG